MNLHNAKILFQTTNHHLTRRNMTDLKREILALVIHHDDDANVSDIIYHTRAAQATAHKALVELSLEGMVKIIGRPGEYPRKKVSLSDLGRQYLMGLAREVERLVSGE